MIEEIGSVQGGGRREGVQREGRGRAGRDGEKGRKEGERIGEDGE